MEHLQSIQDEAAINALMEKLEAQQADAEEGRDAPGPARSGVNGRTAAADAQQHMSNQNGAAEVGLAIDY